MTEQNREAYPIQWNAPGAGTGHSAWQGPRPDAQLPQESSTSMNSASPEQGQSQSLAGQQPAPQPSGLGNPWGQTSGDSNQSNGENAAQVGWAGAAASAETAQEISQSHPQDSGYGWSGNGGSTRFEAPDRDDHAPRSAALSDAAPRNDDAAAHYASTPQGSAPQDSMMPSTSTSMPQTSTPQDGGWNASGQAADAPSTPQSAQQAQPASYASAPVSGSTGAGAGEQWGGNTYASAPPQVVTQHDDLPEDSLTIGRSRDNSIVLDDMLVSRRHVVITADDEGLLLRDLGSRNGTFVNGRRVEQTHLHEGDRIGIGASTFEVRDGWLVSV